MKPVDFFTTPQTTAQKQYEALRMFFVENKSAAEVADAFGYTYRGFTTIVSDFRKKLKENQGRDLFFKELKRGRKEILTQSKDLIIALRKKYYSIEDIKVVLDSKGFSVSEKSIHNILKQQGFARLPRRQKFVKQNLEKHGIQADKSVTINCEPESFKSTSAGILCLLPSSKNMESTN